MATNDAVVMQKAKYWQRSPLGRSGAVALSESLLSEDHIRA